MKTIIHATTDEEHESLRVDGKRTFAVRLSLSLEPDEQGDAISEDEALEAYKSFVEMVATISGNQGSFSVWSWENGTLAPIAPADHDLIAGIGDDEFRLKFKRWLADRKPTLGKAGPSLGQTDMEVTQQDMTGYHLVMGAAGWPAPIPQMLGLSFLVTTADSITASSLVVFPIPPGANFQADTPTPDDQDPTQTKSFTIGYTGGDYTSCWASISVPAQTGDTLLDSTTGFVDGTGIDEHLGHATRRIEQRGGGLFTGYLAATEIVWPDYSPPGKPKGDAPRLESRPEFGTTDKDKFDIACLAWQAASMVGTAFDTLLLAIAMPGKDNRDGQTLGPFLDLLVGDDFPHIDPARPVSAAERRDKYRTAIRKGVCDVVAKPALDDIWTLAGFDASAIPLSKALVRRAMGLDTVEVTATTIRDELKKQAAKQGGGDPTKVIVEVDRDDLARRVSGELAPLHEKLLGEEGAERALVALLGREEVKAAVLALFPPPNDAASPQARKEAEAAYDKQVANLKSVLAQRVNGAEAARQSVGSLVVDLATDSQKDKLLTRLLDNIQARIKGWDFWAKRLLDGAFSPTPAVEPAPFLLHLPKALDEVFANIADIPEKRNDDYVVIQPAVPARKVAGDAIEAAGKAMQADALGRLFPPTSARFVPDTAPAPLLVPIALDTRIDDDGGIDEFTAGFAGLGVLAREEGGNWAHACLAEILNPKDEGEFKDVDGKITYKEPVKLLDGLAVAPLPSAVVDGRRELFITYSGAPFTSYAHGHVLPDEAEAQTSKPFHVLDWPGPEAADTFSPLPPLAYGQKIEFAVHVIGRSGTLPAAIRSSAPPPWKPNPTPGTMPAIAATATVSRRTAIGRVGLADAGTVRRIGRWPEDVLPLTSDYPRLVVEKDIAVDVFRDSNGAGLIELPTEPGQKTVVVLDGIEVWSDTDASLTIVVGTIPGESAPSGTPGEEIRLTVPAKQGERTKATLTIERTSTDKVKIHAGTGLKELLVGDRPTVWMRLMSAVAISLADPGKDSGSRTTAVRPAPLDLLLMGAETLNAPDGAQAGWITPFGDLAKVEISFPRMSFQDFMRWTNNERLVDEALGATSAKERERRRRVFDRFRALLVALDMERQTSPDVAKLLDALPDLAVRAIRVSAAPADSLVLGPGKMGADDSRARAAVAEDIKVPSLWDLLDKSAESLDVPIGKLHAVRIAALLVRIDSALRRTIVIKTTKPSPVDANGLLRFSKDSDEVELTVPGGLTVRLAVRSLTPTRYFKPSVKKPEVIDPRLLQYAVGVIGADHVFEGAQLAIETMIAPLTRPEKMSNPPEWLRTREQWAEDRRVLLDHMPAGSARRYDLEVTPDPLRNWQWRQVGTITTRTQAWRFTGRPIYSWIDPWDYVAQAFEQKARRARLATFPLTREDEGLKAFEEELFLGREDSDARPRTVRLLPMGHATRLVEMVADEHKGATLHRHALELRSRYAAALIGPERTGVAVTWKKDDWFDRWRRIVVLARRPEGEITRPQLRALLPLTRRPDAQGDAAAIAPPVLAILQEEPLANGGLATRVVSEIRTGIGYAAASRPGSKNDKVFVPCDARREIGPDPRLDYRPMLERAARQATLPQEGPIGLTFDRDADATAEFPNTAFVLHPEVPFDPKTEKPKLEEHFLSVGVRRYLDPAWLIPDDTEDAIEAMNCAGTTLPLDRGLILTRVGAGFTLAFKGDAGTSCFDAVWIEETKLNVDRRAVDPIANEVITQGEKDASPLVLCEWTDTKEVISLLLIPGDRDRLSVCAIKTPSASKSQRRGSGRGPVVLTSFECTVPKGARMVAVWPPDSKDDGADRASRPVGRIRHIAASPTTALEWVRTNQDFDRVSTLLDGSLKRLPVVNVRSNLTVANKGVTVSFADGSMQGAPQIWIRPAQSIARTPTHTQRHMIAFLCSTLRGVGSDIERPLGAWLMPGRDFELPKAAQDVDTIRLIEIETPARITAWMAVNANTPEPYRFAYFDLVAIGQAIEDQQQKHVLLRFRYVGSRTALPIGALIHVTLFLPPERSIKFTVGRLKRETVDFIVAFDLTTDKASALTVWLVADVSGALSSPETVPSEATGPQAKKIHALAVSIDRIDGMPSNVSEAWFEVSTLVSPEASQPNSPEASQPNPSNNDPWRFNFDWLFGASANGLTIADCAGSRLAEVVEAQARIVTVSPSIQVTR
jgi:hypothetical protein